MAKTNKRQSALLARRMVGSMLFACAVGFAAAAGAAESGSTGSMPPGHPPMGKPSTTQQKPASDQPAKLVDINSASRAELKTLPGIGDAEADRIIKGRPYLSKAELVTRNVMPEGVYVALKKQIIAKQPSNKPATKK